MTDISEMTEDGILLIEAHTETQNERVMACDNQIDGMDRHLWRYLNNYTNHHWLCMILALEELQELKPEAFNAGHTTIFERAKKALVDNIDARDQVMLRKENRSTNWRAFMSMREVWNNVVGVANTNKVATNPDLGSLKDKVK